MNIVVILQYKELFLQDIFCIAFKSLIIKGDMMENTNAANTGKFIFVIASVMTIIGMITAGYLYSSFAYSAFEKIVYGTMGVSFALLSVSFLPSVKLLWDNCSPLLSALVFLAWIIVLIPICIQTHQGFSAYVQSRTEQANAINSIATQSAHADLEHAKQRIQANANYANLDINTAANRKTALEREITSLQVALSNCPKNHVTKCINPANEQIQSKNSELLEIEKSLAGFNAYQNAIASKAVALKEMQQSANGGDNSTIHPLFLVQSQVFGYEPKVLQAWFLTGSAIAFELLASLAFLVAMSLSATHKAKQPALVSSATHKAKQPALVSSATHKQPALVSSATHEQPALVSSATHEQPALVSSATHKAKQCSNCGTTFEPKVAHQKYCSVACRNEANGKNKAA